MDVGSLVSFGVDLLKKVTKICAEVTGTALKVTSKVLGKGAEMTVKNSAKAVKNADKKYVAAAATGLVVAIAMAKLLGAECPCKKK